MLHQHEKMEKNNKRNAVVARLTQKETTKEQVGPVSGAVVVLKRRAIRPTAVGHAIVSVATFFF